MEAAVRLEGVAAAEAAELTVHQASSLQAHEPPRRADHAHRPRWPACGVRHPHRQGCEARRFWAAEAGFRIRGQIRRRPAVGCPARAARLRRRPRARRRRRSPEPSRGRAATSAGREAAARARVDLGARDQIQEPSPAAGVGPPAAGRAARRRCSIAAKLLMPTPLPLRTGVSFRRLRPDRREGPAPCGRPAAPCASSAPRSRVRRGAGEPPRPPASSPSRGRSVPARGPPSSATGGPRGRSPRVG